MKNLRTSAFEKLTINSQRFLCHLLSGKVAGDMGHSPCCQNGPLRGHKVERFADGGAAGEDDLRHDGGDGGADAAQVGELLRLRQRVQVGIAPLQRAGRARAIACPTGVRCLPRP